jgi:SAM-dependent methyltransferase
MTSVEVSFDRSWKAREESHYNHWVRGSPRNQIQLAFRRHWITFGRYIADCPGNEVLEVGCGRGTIGSYFADAGYRVTLLDSSPAILSIAQRIYRANGHHAHFAAGDAFELPFDDSRFSICISIGLLEHFDKIEPLMREQLRVLRPGGVMLAYVVPERPDSIQHFFNWLNRTLRFLSRVSPSAGAKAKEPIYRNGLASDTYLLALQNIGIRDKCTHGMYPLPMISHSPDFPFSLLPAPVERLLVLTFSVTLALRHFFLRNDPWICRERTGQAFLVVARKPT